MKFNYQSNMANALNMMDFSPSRENPPASACSMSQLPPEVNNNNSCYLSCMSLARLRSFISSVILPSSLSYVPCTVLKFRALDRFPGRNVPGIFYSRNFLNWVLTALFHPLANV